MKKFLNNIEEYLVASSLFIMLVIAFANVLSRKVFHASWAFTEEITTNLFILSSLLGAAIAAKRGSHLGLSIFTDFIPKKYQKYVHLFTVVCAVIFCGFLLKEGFVVAMNEKAHNQLTPALGWPQWIFGMTIPIGAFFILVRFVQYGILNFRKKEDN